MSEIVGIPCVGGKSKLMPYLREIMFDIATKHQLTKYLSACGGGGKDVFNQKAPKSRFPRGIMYNEYERGLYNLVTALSTMSNIQLINKGVDELLKKHFADSNGKEDVYWCIRKMFDEALAKADDENLDCLESAIYETVVVFGSVQNNRQTCSPNIGGKENGFFDYFKKHQYEETLRKVTRRIYDMASFETYNEDCVDMVKKFGKDENLLLYIDPPYFNCLNNYKTEFGFDKHMQLCKACMDAKSKVVISMHDAGVAPYLLKLFPHEDWHAYILPPIPHSSRGNLTTKETLKQIYGSEFVDVDGKVAENTYETFDLGLFDDKSVEEIIFCNFDIADYAKYQMKLLDYSIEDDFYMIFGKMIYIMYKEKEPKEDKIVDKESINSESCKDIVRDIHKYYDFDFTPEGLEDPLKIVVDSVRNIVWDFHLNQKNIGALKRKGKKSSKKLRITLVGFFAV